MEKATLVYGPDEGLPPEAYLAVEYRDENEPVPIGMLFHGITVGINASYRSAVQPLDRLSVPEVTALSLASMGTSVNNIADFMQRNKGTIGKYRRQYSRKLGAQADFTREERSHRATVIASLTGLYRFQQPEIQKRLPIKHRLFIQALAHKYNDTGADPIKKSGEWLQKKMFEMRTELQLQNHSAALLYAYAIGELVVPRLFKKTAKGTFSSGQRHIQTSDNQTLTLKPGVKYVIH